MPAGKPAMTLAPLDMPPRPNFCTVPMPTCVTSRPPRHREPKRQPAVEPRLPAQPPARARSASQAGQQARPELSSPARNAPVPEAVAAGSHSQRLTPGEDPQGPARRYRGCGYLRGDVPGRERPWHRVDAGSTPLAAVTIVTTREGLGGRWRTSRA